MSASVGTNSGFGVVWAPSVTMMISVETDVRLKEAIMIQISDAARDEIVRTLDEQGKDRVVRIYVAGHG